MTNRKFVTNTEEFTGSLYCFAKIYSAKNPEMLTITNIIKTLQPKKYIDASKAGVNANITLFIGANHLTTGIFFLSVIFSLIS
jgi:HKD family nuclease